MRFFLLAGFSQERLTFGQAREQFFHPGAWLRVDASGIYRLPYFDFGPRKASLGEGSLKRARKSRKHGFHDSNSSFPAPAAGFDMGETFPDIPVCFNQGKTRKTSKESFKANSFKTLSPREANKVQSTESSTAEMDSTKTISRTSIEWRGGGEKGEQEISEYDATRGDVYALVCKE
jgi:hypothetical protein